MAIIYTDGGSRGNPGPAAAGYWITEYGKIIDWAGHYIGTKTNNDAEYEAVYLGLYAASKLGCRYVEVRSDSKLVVEQLNGHWNVKDPSRLAPIINIMTEFEEVTLTHIPREQNAVADFIVNITLNEQEKK